MNIKFQLFESILNVASVLNETSNLNFLFRFHKICTTKDLKVPRSVDRIDFFSRAAKLWNDSPVDMRTQRFSYNTAKKKLKIISSNCTWMTKIDLFMAKQAGNGPSRRHI